MDQSIAFNLSLVGAFLAAVVLAAIRSARFRAILGEIFLHPFDYSQVEERDGKITVRRWRA